MNEQLITCHNYVEDYKNEEILINVSNIESMRSRGGFTLIYYVSGKQQAVTESLSEIEKAIKKLNIRNTLNVHELLQDLATSLTRGHQ